EERHQEARNEDERHLRHRRRGSSTERPEAKRGDEVEHAEKIPGHELPRAGELAIASQGKPDPWRGRADRHVAQAGGPGEKRRQYAVGVEREEFETGPAPGLNRGEQTQVERKHIASEGAQRRIGGKE